MTGYIERARIRLRTDRVLRERLRGAIGVLALLITLTWLLAPIIWAFLTSLKSQAIAGAYPPVFWGFELRWQNYATVIRDHNLFAFMRNGVIVATISTILSMLLAVPHAYAVSKYEYRLRSISFYGILAARIIPPISIAVPFYILFQQFGLVNTKLAVVIVFTFLFEPFAVWIMKGFFDGLPRALISAARIDGCTKFQAFYKIMLPLAVPAVVSSIIITWIIAWNEFTLVFILTTTEQAQTLPVGVLLIVQDHFVPWNRVAAASMMGAIPSLTIVIVFQRYLQKGLVDLRL